MYRVIITIIFSFYLTSCFTEGEILFLCTGNMNLAGDNNSPSVPRTEPFIHTFSFFQATRPVYVYRRTATSTDGFGDRPAPTPKLVWIMRRNGDDEMFERHIYEESTNSSFADRIMLRVEADSIHFLQTFDRWGGGMPPALNSQGIIINRINGNFQQFGGGFSEHGTCERMPRRKI